MKAVDMEFGRAIRVARAARNLSQKDVAHGAGIHPSYLSLLEKGERRPSVDALESLASALDIPPHLLTLLASEKDELRGVSPEQAATIGMELLELLLSSSAE